MVTNYELKQKARTALQDNWQTALMVALIASLPSLVSQVLTILVQSDVMQTVQYLLKSMKSNATVGDLLALMEAAGLSLTTYLPTVGVGLIAWLVSPFLTLGLLNYFFMLLRGEREVPINTVFSRTSCFFKGIGLNLMTSLRVFLWMLPGMAVEVLAVVLAPNEEIANLALVLMPIGMVVMLVLGIRAALHYSMSTRVMAESPEKGINQCIWESVAMMRHRKMLLVSLELSFILLNLLISLVESLLAGLLGNVLGATFSMALTFALNIYMQMAVSAFYEAHRAEERI